MWRGTLITVRNPRQDLLEHDEEHALKQNPRLIKTIIRPPGIKCSQEDELRWENVPIVYAIKIQFSWALRDWSQLSAWIKLKSLERSSEKKKKWLSDTNNTYSNTKCHTKQTKKNSVKQIIFLLFLNKWIKTQCFLLDIHHPKTPV